MYLAYFMCFSSHTTHCATNERISECLRPQHLSFAMCCRPSLDRSKEHLIKLGALKEDAAGKLATTNVGEILVHMPVQIEMGLSIIAAVNHQCSEEVARIACMVATGGSRVFRQGQQGQGQSSGAFAAQSGDHVTYLNVFEAWLANHKSQQWCDQQGLHSAVLEAADEILHKVHRVMGQHLLPTVQFPGNDSTQRSEAILQSLCAGHFRQLASAADPTDSKLGFWLVEDYESNPKAAGLHRGSVLLNTSQIHTVLFGQQLATGNGEKLLACVSQVDPQWVVQAASGDGAALQNAQAVKAMERKEYHVPVMPFPTVGCLPH